MPRERVANKVVSAEKNTVTFEFLGKAAADGKRPITNTLVVDVSKFKPEIQKMLLLNGAAQKIGDSYADSDDGTPYENAQAMVEQLMSGTWAQRGGGGERISYLVRALVVHSKQSEETVRAFLDGLKPEERKALPEDPAIAPIIARLKVEDAQKKAAEVAEKTKGKAGAPSVLAGLVKASPKK